MGKFSVLYACLRERGKPRRGISKKKHDAPFSNGYLHIQYILLSPALSPLHTLCFPTTSFFCFFVLFFYCCFSSLLSFSPSSTSQKERFYTGKTYNNLESPICIRGVRGFSGLGSLSKLEKTKVCSFLNQSQYQYFSAHTSLTIAKESFLGL